MQADIYESKFFFLVMSWVHILEISDPTRLIPCVAPAKPVQMHTG